MPCFDFQLKLPLAITLFQINRAKTFLLQVTRWLPQAISEDQVFFLLGNSCKRETFYLNLEYGERNGGSGF